MLNEQQWATLRDLRLVALKDSPASFLSTYDKELDYDEPRWRLEFSRGECIVVERQKASVGLIGITSGSDIPSTDRYLEYLWIAPESRRSGVATELVKTLFKLLDAAGTPAVWLWILDGNEPARRLYEKCGFVSTYERQPALASSLCEERMRLELKKKPMAARGKG